jgi:hypothetical protein
MALDMKRIRSASLALVSVGAVTAGLGAARPHYGGTLRVEMSDSSAVRERALPLVFETLTRIDAARGARPLLADSWQGDASGTHWRVRLREGTRLHDGSVLQGWQVASALRSVERTWTIEADGDLLTMDLPAPAPDLAWTLATPNHAIEVRALNGARLGTGPFRLERDDDNALSLRAFDDYREGRPFVDSVEARIRPAPSLMADLEAGRADVVAIAPTDVRRVEGRGLSIAESAPMSLIALVFEPQRAGPEFAGVRRAVSAAVNRGTVASVLLQGHAAPARSVLPGWIPGYMSSPFQRKEPLARPAVAALPADQRTLTIRVDPSDRVARSVAERVVADAREWGFSLTVQAPAGLAPRADARIVHLRLSLLSPERMLVATLAARLFALPDAMTRATENDLLDDGVIVPIVHVPDLYGMSENVATFNARAVRESGEWNMASLWLRGVRR